MMTPHGVLHHGKAHVHELEVLTRKQAKAIGVAEGITSLFGTRAQYTPRDTQCPPIASLGVHDDAVIVSDVPTKHGRVMIMWNYNSTASPSAALVPLADLTIDI